MTSGPVVVQVLEGDNAIKKYRDVMGATNPEKACLLYTSDAADERSSVDLGGRRIIKKKKETCGTGQREENKKKTSKAKALEYDE